jgi:UDP:flavonoid glycosyltransferase YjiC (YdhE family)
MNIAILALYPDAGHVVPLLKIGAMLVARGHEVICLLPNECSALTSSYGLTHTQIGPALSTIAAKATGKFGGCTILMASFDVYWRDYYTAIFADSVHMVERILKELKSRPVDLILVDNHQFPEVSAGIGAELNVPVVFHDSVGGLKSRAGPPIVTFYGKRMSPWREAGLLAFGALYSLFREAARIYRFCRQGLFLASFQARKQLCTLLSKLPPKEQSYLGITSAGMVSAASRRMKYHFATGLGLLEHRHRGLALHPDRQAFGPILDLPETPLPDDLKRWLDDHPKRAVVYVTFGSMAKLSTDRLRMLVSAFSALDAPVLWAGGPCSNAVPTLSLPKRVRIETFVPQRSVLSHNAVGACVTHGGSGTVLECLAAGVPMVVMPLMWDQPYNAQFVEDLRAGIRLDWRHFSGPTFMQTLQSVLLSSQYRQRASSIAAELRSQRGSDKALQFLTKVADSKDAESWLQEH